MEGVSQHTHEYVVNRVNRGSFEGYLQSRTMVIILNYFVSCLSRRMFRVKDKERMKLEKRGTRRKLKRK